MDDRIEAAADIIRESWEDVPYPQRTRLQSALCLLRDRASCAPSPTITPDQFEAIAHMEQFVARHYVGLCQTYYSAIENEEVTKDSLVVLEMLEQSGLFDIHTCFKMAVTAAMGRPWQDRIRWAWATINDILVHRLGRRRMLVPTFPPI